MNYPQFVENNTYIAQDASRSEVDQLKAMLSNLTRVHLLSAANFDSFDNLIHEYLLAGIEVFGLETGIVSEITGDSYRICDVISPLDILEKNQVFELKDTYCSEVVRSGMILGFPEVGKLEYMSCHPVYQNLKLEAYLSAPILVEGQLFGTLNFTSTQVRLRGFSCHENDLIVLLANSIASFIVLRRKEEELVSLNQRIKRFVGFVAHDLRNPIGSILSLCQFGLRPSTSPERLFALMEKIQNSATTALEFVGAILENAALASGKLPVEIKPYNLQVLLTEAKESVLQFNEQAETKIKITADHEIMVGIDALRIKQCLMNLFINGLKYSPADGAILVVTRLQNQKVFIDISNDIGRAQKIRPETYGSVGFGLDIAREILTAHASNLVIDQSDSRYVASFSLDVI